MPSHDNTLNDLEIGENLLNSVKGIYKNPTANTVLNGERLKAFKMRTSALIISIQHVWKVQPGKLDKKKLLTSFRLEGKM